MTPVLVTGAAGFIGFHLSRRLLRDGVEVVGLDNLNDYYDVRLKQARLARLEDHPGFHFVKADLADREAIACVFEDVRPRQVVNLAAQAGVRYSLTHPHAYVDANIAGFLNVLEGYRHGAAEHLVYASSSSVYGGNTRLPFCVGDNVDHPLSLYAATKKANELMAHSYAHLYGLPCTGLRFFNVYGPWGRPDAALSRFSAILKDRPIEVYNYGHHRRDFTYIDDIVEGIVRVMERPAREPGVVRRESRSRQQPGDVEDTVGDLPPPELNVLHGARINEGRAVAGRDRAGDRRTERGVLQSAAICLMELSTRLCTSAEPWAATVSCRHSRGGANSSFPRELKDSYTTVTHPSQRDRVRL